MNGYLLEKLGEVAKMSRLEAHKVNAAGHESMLNQGFKCCTEAQAFSANS
ncbi:MAG: hypothetical protein RhofKO_32580 [Rhodothermales bacterium]